MHAAAGYERVGEIFRYARIARANDAKFEIIFHKSFSDCKAPPQRVTCAEAAYLFCYAVSAAKATVPAMRRIFNAYLSRNAPAIIRTVGMKRTIFTNRFAPSLP